MGSMEPPLGLELVLRNTDDGPNGTLLPGKRTRKTVALAHISMLTIENSSVGW